jgi:VanZ family protein
MFRSFLAPLAWALLILFFSTIPSADLPDFSFWTLVSFDKFAHVVMYAVLSFQVMKGSIRQYANKMLRYNATKVAVISSIIYGGAIELFQEYMLTDRYGSFLDMLANIIGAFLGIVIFRWIFTGYLR